MEDYNLHPRSLSAIKKYIRKLDKSEKCCVSFTNNGYMFNSSEINDLCSRYGVSFSKSILIETNDNIDIVINHPSNKCEKFIEKYIQKEKKSWLLLIFEYLFDDDSFVYINDIMTRTEKKLEEFEVFDISTELFLSQEENCKNSPIELFNTKMKDIVKEVPKRLCSIDFCIQNLENEYIYLVLNEKSYNNEKFKMHLSRKEIYGVITDKNKFNIKTNKTVRNGSDKWV